MRSNQALTEVVGRLGDLPALPAVVSEVLRITEDPRSAVQEITHAIQSDPALTAKILRLSNSSYYGMRQHVGTVQLALVILGVREVRNIVLGITVFETLRSRQGDLDAAQEIWQDSLAIAGLSRKLASTLSLGLQGEEFVTGLLADVGKMMLFFQDGDAYIGTYNAFKHEPRALLQAEAELFGFTHADAGAAILLHWGLPQTIIDSIWRQYPHPQRHLNEAKDPRLAAVVRLAKAAKHDDLAGDPAAPSVIDEEAWHVLAGCRRPIPADQRGETLLDLKQEIDESVPVPL